jgi:multisubunit Na+/H+ antiporter MnhF subunit
MWVLVAVMALAGGVSAWAAWRSPNQRRDRLVVSAMLWLATAGILALQILDVDRDIKQAIVITLALLIVIPAALFRRFQPPQ